LIIKEKKWYDITRKYVYVFFRGIKFIHQSEMVETYFLFLYKIVIIVKRIYYRVAILYNKEKLVVLPLKKYEIFSICAVSFHSPSQEYLTVF